MVMFCLGGMARITSTLPPGWEFQRLSLSRAHSPCWVSLALSIYNCAILSELVQFSFETGIYIQLFLGPSEKSAESRALQYVGLAASLLSLVKGCSDWWVRDAKKMEEPTLFETVKASLFFMPHLLFRVTAVTFCAAFMGYYAFIPFTLLLFFVIGNFLMIGADDRDLFVTLPFTIVAPTLFDATKQKCRTLMKRTIIITNSILLITLTFIFVLPVLVTPKDLASTYGLCHLNFQSLPGAYS